MSAEAIHVELDPAADVVNPFARPVGPALCVIFGAAGDLTKRKLIPALCNLWSENLIDPRFAILGLGRTALDTASYKARVAEDIEKFATHALPPAVVEEIVARTHYLAADFNDPAAYARLKKELAVLDEKFKTNGNHLFYLSTAPEHFAPIVEQLGAAGLVNEEGGSWKRVIVEKPFGIDLDTARELNQRLRCVLREEQIYRIDHYLGKETVQNILVFRFANGMFEPIWNRQYIDNVQITVAESIGVEGRGGYYDTAGALRDMVPNHLLQLLALVAMEPPTSFEAEAVREEKAKVLRAIPPMTPEKVLTDSVRGQYGEGYFEGKKVPAYRAEDRVAPKSHTDTFVAMRLAIDNWRWADVPFYLRTGKRMAKRTSEISIQFRRPPLLLFRNTPVEHLSRNVLVIRVQPDEGITLRFGAKIPGPSVRMSNVAMDFRYKDHFTQPPSTGYETLIYDCIKGDPTLFQRADMVEMGWAIVNPMLEVWSALPPRTFPNYAAGSWGPKEADELLEREGRKWRKIEE